MRGARQICLWISMLAFMSACQGEVELISHLAEDQANEVMVALEGQKIKVKKNLQAGRVVSYSLTVSAADASNALRLLVGNKLPKEKSMGLATVYPINGSGLIPTATEERAKFLMAIQGEIENMLKILPGIIQARVVIVLPNTDSLREIGSPAPKATASVAVVYNPTHLHIVPGVTPADIKHLVASAVPDLPPSHVSVVMAANSSIKLLSSDMNKPLPTLSSVSSAHKELEQEKKMEDFSISTRLPDAPSQIESPHSSLKAHVQIQRIHLLLWLFGFLAIVGMVLGIAGLLRTLDLRKQLANAAKGPVVSPPQADAAESTAPAGPAAQPDQPKPTQNE